jgi:hypothetical protein
MIFKIKTIPSIQIINSFALLQLFGLTSELEAINRILHIVAGRVEIDVAVTFHC